ncbi:unnamed protein product, partial [Discosporangium mesarthrocarpum]
PQALACLSSGAGNPAQAEDAVRVLATLASGVQQGPGAAGPRTARPRPRPRVGQGPGSGLGKQAAAACSAARLSIRNLASGRSLSVGNGKLPVALRALAAYAVEFPEAFHPHEAKVWAFAGACLAEG